MFPQMVVIPFKTSLIIEYDVLLYRFTSERNGVLFEDSSWLTWSSELVFPPSCT